MRTPRKTKNGFRCFMAGSLFLLGVSCLQAAEPKVDKSTPSGDELHSVQSQNKRETLPLFARVYDVKISDRLKKEKPRFHAGSSGRGKCMAENAERSDLTVCGLLNPSRIRRMGGR